MSPISPCLRIPLVIFFSVPDTAYIFNTGDDTALDGLGAKELPVGGSLVSESFRVPFVFD